MPATCRAFLSVRQPIHGSSTRQDRRYELRYGGARVPHRLVARRPRLLCHNVDRRSSNFAWCQRHRALVATQNLQRSLECVGTPHCLRSSQCHWVLLFRLPAIVRSHWRGCALAIDVASDDEPCAPPYGRRAQFENHSAECRSPSDFTRGCCRSGETNASRSTRDTDQKTARMNANSCRVQLQIISSDDASRDLILPVRQSHQELL